MIPRWPMAKCFGDSACFALTAVSAAGFGRTFSFESAEVLPRHTIAAPLLWQLFGGLLEGSLIKAAFEAVESQAARAVAETASKGARRRASQV